ncbi:MAG TPA: hypothetical protein VFW52_00665 [Candidatus Saccharimonadales bacterium]|nr:hypothetical protein [Candidatus Saccharimonadales bacterium]
MKKLCVLLYAIGLISISAYGLSNNSYYVQLLMNTSGLYMLARITLVLCLVVYAFVPKVRLYSTRFVCGFGGVALLALGAISVWSPTLLGHSSGYALLGDSLSLIEGGILAIILSAELSARRSRVIATSLQSLKNTIHHAAQKRTYASLKHAATL